MWYLAVFLAGLVIGAVGGVAVFFTASEIAWTVKEYRQSHATESHS